jgi:hypothetical protein
VAIGASGTSAGRSITGRETNKKINKMMDMELDTAVAAGHSQRGPTIERSRRGQARSAGHGVFSQFSD